MDALLRYYQLLLSKTFEAAFDTEPLQPGALWVVPLCSREMGERRMYPHLHVMYVQHYGGEMGFAIALVPEGADIA